eukprot:scpid61010/ scgid29862/ 
MQPTVLVATVLLDYTPSLLQYPTCHIERHVAQNACLRYLYAEMYAGHHTGEFRRLADSVLISCASCYPIHVCLTLPCTHQFRIPLMPAGNGTAPLGPRKQL